MTLNKDGLEAAHAAYAKTTGGMLEGHPMANAITAYLSALPASDHNDETRKFIAAVELVENAGWVVMRPEKVPAASDHAGLVERLRTAVQLATSMGARGQHASNIYNLAEEAATVIQTLEEQIDQWEAWAEGLTPGELSNGMNNIKNRLFAAEQQVRDMVDALNWALGATGEFRPSGVGIGPFWWRAELAARAGLTFDRETCTYRLLLKEGGE